MPFVGQSYREQQNVKYNDIVTEYLDKLPDYCTSYMNSVMDSLAVRSRCGYIQDIHTFFVWLKSTNVALKDIDIKDISLDILEMITADDIDDYMAYLTQYTLDGIVYNNGKAAKSRKLSALRSLFGYLNKRGKIKNNPAILVNNPKLDTHDVRVLTQEEREAIFNAILRGVSEGKKAQEIHEVLAKRDYAIYVLFLGSGLRISELVGIDVHDINFTNGHINVVRKGAKFTYIIVNRDVLDALEDYIFDCRDRLKPNDDDFDALFISRKHCRMSTRAVERMIKKYTDALFGDKHGITPHKLRATYATQVLEETDDLLAAAQALNHKSTDVTYQKYINKTEGALKKASTINVFGYKKDEESNG